MADEGWVKVHRKVQNNPLWTAEPFTRGQAWIDLILLANHKDGYIYVRDHKIQVKRGQVGWSENRLSKRWQWSRTKVRKFLDDLEKEQQLKQEKSKSYSLLTLINYNDYQSKEQQENNSSTSERQQKDTNKNDKNEKNDKNKFIPPVKSELIEYFRESGKVRVEHLDIEAENFINHYADKGWKNSSGKKMREWKRQASTWANNYIKYNGKPEDIDNFNPEHAKRFYEGVTG